MDRMTRALEGLLRWGAGLVPPERRGWAEAVRAEAGEVPGGTARLGWLAGGLWLVVREAGMVRRIGYGLGVAAVVMAAALAARYLWSGAHAGRDTGWDRARLLLLVALLAGLPWVARRRGVFGPVGRSFAARMVRAGGCAALVALVLDFARIEHFPEPAMYGLLNGATAAAWSWAREVVALGLIGAGLAALLIVTARRPNVRPVPVAWSTVAAGLVLFFAVAPLQVLIAFYAAGILAVTSRRSPVTPATLAISAAVGVGGGLLVVALWDPTRTAPAPGLHPKTEVPLLFIALIAVAAAGTGAAGAAARRAARRRSGGIGDPLAVRARAWQYLAARPADRRERRPDAPPSPGQPRGRRRGQVPGDTGLPLHRGTGGVGVLPCCRAGARPWHRHRRRAGCRSPGTAQSAAPAIPAGRAAARATVGPLLVGRGAGEALGGSPGEPAER